MTEAEMRAHRNRPFPVTFMALSRSLARRAEQIANEAPRVYHEPEQRRPVEAPIAMAKAIQHRIKRGK